MLVEILIEISVLEFPTVLRPRGRNEYPVPYFVTSTCNSMCEGVCLLIGLARHPSCV